MKYFHHETSQRELHRWEVLDHIHNEIVRYLLQMVKDLEGTINEIGLVVGNAPLLAKGMDKLVSFAEVVSGDHGEEVVLDLVLEAAAEPVDEGLGDAVPSSNVPGGGHLQRPEVRAGSCIVCGHAVVAKAEDEGKE